jgi:CrcB protein
MVMSDSLRGRGPAVDGRSDGEKTVSAVPVAPPDAIAEAELAEAPDDRAAPASPGWRSRLATTTAVGLGGVLGANARYWVGVWVAERWGTAFPWGTLAINVSGSFVLGFYLTLVTERFAGRSTTRLFVATGFLGAYTTFSTFSYETVRLIQQGAVVPALAYVAASLIAGLVAGVAGVATAHAL